jgi:hypothetical protein
MPPVPAGTAPLKLEWQVNPEDLVDATDTNLILTMPKNCKLAKCLSTCAELPASPSSTDSTRVEVAYRWCGCETPPLSARLSDTCVSTSASASDLSGATGSILLLTKTNTSQQVRTYPDQV